MDKIRQQKLEYFLLDLDGKIKEIKDYLLLDKGAILLDEIDKFEEENAEFLQYNPPFQEELNKRKWIIQYVIFPIIDDDKVEELLQYHLLESLSAKLDIEELMKMRAITISELLWPKISQQYLKALMQNTQLLGSSPLSIGDDKASYLPYIKNWISAYNRRFGIDKHSGLEPHQFVLEDPNAQRLNKSQKEKLLQVLKFYESLKVYSLSEIEGELRKMQMGFAAQQAAAYSLKRDQEANPKKYSPPSSPKKEQNKTVLKKMSPEERAATVQKELLDNERIKFMTGSYGKSDYGNKSVPSEEKTDKKTNREADKTEEKKIPKEKERDIENATINQLLEKYPSLQSFKLTANSISLPVAPFSLTPSIQNWIQYYHKECGKGRHSLQEREEFIEKLKKNQNIGPADSLKLDKIFRSVDDKSPLPFDKKNNELLLDQVKVGEKIKTEEKPRAVSKKLDPIMNIGEVGMLGSITSKEDRGHMDLELVPAESSEKKLNDNGKDVPL